MDRHRIAVLLLTAAIASVPLNAWISYNGSAAELFCQKSASQTSRVNSTESSFATVETLSVDELASAAAVSVSGESFQGVLLEVRLTGPGVGETAHPGIVY